MTSFHQQNEQRRIDRAERFEKRLADIKKNQEERSKALVEKLVITDEEMKIMFKPFDMNADNTRQPNLVQPKKDSEQVGSYKEPVIQEAIAELNANGRKKKRGGKKGAMKAEIEQKSGNDKTAKK